MKIGDSMKRKVMICGITFILAMLILMFFLMFSYQISPKLISISSMRLENNNMKLDVTINNADGYIRKIKVVNKDNKAYVYFIGTTFKAFRLGNKNVYEVNINMKNIKKVTLKGRSIETVIFEIKDI